LGVYETGLIIFRPCDRFVDKEYVFNEKFEKLRKDKRLNLDSCQLFFRVDNTRVFKNYRTVFGWAFAHDGVVLANSVPNLSQALRRHLCAREPEVHDSDILLRVSQGNYLLAHDSSIHKSLWFNVGHFDWGADMYTTVHDLVKIPHKKRLARVAALNDIDQNNGYVSDAWLDWCEWKFKNDEYAKPSKYGRIIVDLGITASLQGAYISDACKKHFGDKDIILDDCLFHFVSKPSPEALSNAFDLLMNYTRYRLVLIVFSDDASIGFLEGGVWRYANLDFSSCDSSHTRFMFESMFTAFDFPEEFRKALSGQILANIKILNPDKNLSEKPIYLRPKGMYLQSGITITTLMNTYAWYCCFHAMTHDMRKLEDVVDITRKVGYITTIDYCQISEELTFLKANPVKCACCQVYRPVMNLGVIFRASGVCRQFLPGRRKHSLEERAKKFQSELMNGLLCGIDSKTLNKLNPRSTNKHITYLGAQSNNLHTQRVVHTYTDEELFKRYNLTSDDISSLNNDLDSSGFGTVCYSHAVSVILQKDYGFATPIL
jgi:hypothetical protein